MELGAENSSLMRRYVTLAEAVSFVSVVAIAIVWFSGTYQSKEEAKKVDTRIQALEDDMRAMNRGINQIASDVSYIKGRLEPKAK